MEHILNIENVTKSFGNKKILKNVSFSINSGDILAFIGPNGSGKTTTIKLILGLQTIDKGKISINGYDINKNYKKAISKVGAIVENPDSYMYLTGYQNLKLIANLYPNINESKILELLELVGLSDRKDDKVSKYSLGMRQRLGIAKSLINDPNLLILDEPTNGLDPAGIKDLRELLKHLAQKGLAILISSHNLSELESFCNKVCMINNGQTSSIELLKNIKSNSKKYLFEVDSIEGIEDKQITFLKNNKFIFEGDKKQASDMVKKLVKMKKDIYEMKLIEISLEQAFLDKMEVKNDSVN